MDSQKNINRLVIIFLVEIGVLLGWLVIAAVHGNYDFRIILLLEAIGLASAFRGMNKTLRDRAEMIEKGTWK